MSKKDDILNAAIKIFADNGFKGASTSELAKSANVAEGTIFHHFGNKEGLLIECIKSALNKLVELKREGTKSGVNGLKDLELYIRRHFQVLEENADLFKCVFRNSFAIMDSEDSMFELIRPAVNKFVESAGRSIKNGMEDGSIRKLNHKDVEFVISGLMAGITRNTFLLGFEHDDKYIEYTVEMVTKFLENK